MALFLSEEDVNQLLTMADCIRVVEEVFRQAGEGQAENRPRERIRLPSGYLHFMAGAALGFKSFGFKAYTSFRPRTRFLVNLYDSETGRLLAVMEADRLGQVRTGATSGVATKYMARPEASVAGIIGTGYQARTQLEALCVVRPIKRVKVFDIVPERREAFAREMGSHLGVEVVPVESAEECVRDSDILTTVTTSRNPVLSGEWLKEGVHINAVGSNHWMRRELDDRSIERASIIVVDDLEEARRESGDLIWAVERGVVRWEQMLELKDVVTGRVKGRQSDSDITLFESQGLAIEDVATAALLYQRAREKGVGQELPF
jgi:ornithine cyclodeaminase/alanine dehydrogenase-like protein (mu-crystallin family)